MIPKKIINGLTFYPVPTFDHLEITFGAPLTAFFDRRKLPDIPKRFNDMASILFFSGVALPDLSPKIDKIKAHNALSAWLGSFAPSQEAKLATVGYALWLWTNKTAMGDK